MKIERLNELAKELGHDFQDITYLNRALTHRSAKSDHNERYEFFGDSILSFVVSEALLQKFPKATEGQLTRMRSRLVCGQTLTKIAEQLSLERYVILGLGERQTGGAQRSGIQADALEAIIAAIYLDSGMTVVRDFILRWFAQELESISPKTETKDPKSQLQEWLQAKKRNLPEYEVLAIKGPPHDQKFHVRCSVEGFQAQTGEGSSRRYAEQAAAESMLEIIRER